MSREWTKVADEGGDGEYNDISWKPEDQPELEGKLTGIRHDVGQYTQTVYSVEDEDGQVYSVWSSTVLLKKFDGVSIGSYIKIVYLGSKSGKGGRKYKDFDMFVSSGEAVKDEKAAPKSEKKPDAKAKVEADDDDSEVPF